ncbi:MAG: histidinol-phosphate transaminase [Rikenellaceae bacterium]
MDYSNIVRKNIQSLTPYSTARDEAQSGLLVYLDANESPYENGVNRYPDPRQAELKREVSKIKSVPVENIFIGNGSDEAIDLLYRVFCEPSTDNVVAISPTYGMYKVAAQINSVEYREVLLEPDFSPDADKIISATDSNSKIIFLCSPNNPTGNETDNSIIEKIAVTFNGIVVVDEAYIDFSKGEGFLKKLKVFPNIVVLQTLSKAWGMAGLRIGFAFADAKITALLSSVKYPYNIGSDTQERTLKLLCSLPDERIKTIIGERERVAGELRNLSVVEMVYPSEANFLLVKFKDANEIYNRLLKNGIVVRDRSSQPLCDNCLRISIGLASENDRVLKVLKGENCPVTRYVRLNRVTNETNISLDLDIDGSFESKIETGIPFFNHMLDQLSFHSGISVRLNATSDLEVDEHHAVEDVAIILGEALNMALGSKEGIDRYGFVLPMDDSLAEVAIDLGGRAWLNWNVSFQREYIGKFPTEMFRHFFYSLAVSSKSTIYISASGENDHHKAEAVFKAFAKSLKMAVKRDRFNYKLPTTKGML